MPFVQSPPRLGNQYTSDRALRSYLSRVLSPDVLAEIEPALNAMGERAGGELYRFQLADRENEPRLVQWSAWGTRVDRIEVSPLWREAQRIAAEEGLVALAYERPHGASSRIHQFALVYLFTPSTDLYSCPLAMSDGAAKALLASGNEALIARALPHLVSRNAAEFWTSGQWMTEAAGGSDVALTETIAREEETGWRLYGRKWFTSAIASQMALTLARPEGNPPGGKGLALFYVETSDARGRTNGIGVNRLKDKLGTRKVPTAELTLDATAAELVGGTTDGVKAIAPMLNITRTWNAVTAVALTRRGLALARDYAYKRIAFGAPLSEKPLHVDTLAGLEAEFLGALHLAFFIAELLGRDEAGKASEEQARLSRLLTPVAKLTTARQSVQILSEIVEAFGGAGYVEDTGIPVLLRDAQVLPIWEGTTNVLALETLRAVDAAGGPGVLKREIGILLRELREADLVKISAQVERAVEQAESWLNRAAKAGQEELEAGARRFAMTLGRAMELALLARHAQWSLEHEHDRRALSAARRFAAHGISQLAAIDNEDSRRLVRHEQ
ncbi:MAG TPA: acyl-CoA dehydrogenase family protein [Burkholderiales bacterium]|nr:acyl-CoA dehydrogenase family protein [Burkholderiales bacterium]